MPGFAIGSTKDGPSPVMETARSHRWNIVINGLDNSREIAFYAASMTRPIFEFDVIKMHHRQNEINLPGKYRYGVATLKFYEKITEGGRAETAEYFNEWKSEVVANYLLHSINIKTFRKEVQAILEDGQGRSIYSYIMTHAWPSKVEPSELDYSSSNISMTTATLVFDGVKEMQT